MSMQNLANHIVALSTKERNGITNLELQKVMYFAIGSYISENGRDTFISDMYDEPFEAWPYGPVVRSVYFYYKLFGRNKIVASEGYMDSYKILDEHIRRYLDRSIRELVDLSHKHELWKKNVQKIVQHEKVFYELEDIEDAFIHS